MQHIQNSSCPHPCIVGVCWAGLWWRKEGRQFSSIAMGALKTGNFRLRWEKGETLLVFTLPAPFPVPAPRTGTRVYKGRAMLEMLRGWE